MTQLEDRAPPFNEDAERAVLCACLLDAKAPLLAQRHIKTPAMFYREAHRRIWSAVLALLADSAPVEPVALANRLDASGDLDRIGGRDYIGELIDVVPTGANVEHHAQIVREMADRRAIIEAAQTLAREAYDRETPVNDVITRATSALAPVLVDASETKFINVKDLMLPTLEHLERLRSGTLQPGYTTGWPELDEKMGGGPVEGELVSIVGIPGNGKTAMAVNWCTNAILDQDLTCAFVSAEMRARQLLIRSLNMVASVRTEETRTGKLDDAAWRRLVWAGKQLIAGGRLWIDETPGPSIEDVRAKITLLKQQVPDLKYVFVDFMQLLKQRDRRRGDLESSELKAVAYGLKDLAAELQVVVVATVQPNDKQIEERADKRPQLRDIQGSSGIRQASHFILLCHRPGQFDAAAGDAYEVDIGKARELAQARVRLKWDGPHVRVTSPGRELLDERRLRAYPVDPVLQLGQAS